MKKYSFSHMNRQDLRQAVKRADMSIFEGLIEFLEDDPRTFGSGYSKERIWKYIKRYELSSNDIERLEKAALHYLFRPMSREFRYMCQKMCRIASDKFWKNVKSYLDSDDEIIKLNASCLYPYSEGMKAGEEKRLLWKYHLRWRQQPIQPFPKYYNRENFIALMKEPENWHNGQVLYRDIPEQDLPILYYYPKLDSEIASLDISQSKKDIVLEKIENVLSIWELNTHTIDAWVFAIYLLRYIDDERAVSIIIQFMETKLDYKFESIKKYIVEIGCFKVLHHYDTQEARTTLEIRKEKDKEFADNSRNDTTGWIAVYPCC